MEQLIKVIMIGPGRFWYGDRELDFSPLMRTMHEAVYIAGGTVSTTGLADDLWTAPGPGSLATIRGLLSKSRRKVETAGGTAEQLSRTIRRTGGPSLITIPGSWQVDTEQFRHGTAVARQAYDQGRFTEASSLVTAALKLWYRDPLPDAGNLPFARQCRQDLLNTHWSATLTRIKTTICLGGQREVIPELRELLSDRPDDGEIPMLLAVALYRSEQPG